MHCWHFLQNSFHFFISLTKCQHANSLWICQLVSVWPHTEKKCMAKNRIRNDTWYWIYCQFFLHRIQSMLPFHSSICYATRSQNNALIIFKINKQQCRSSRERCLPSPTLTMMYNISIKLGLIFTHRRQYLAFKQGIYIIALFSMSMK